MRRASVRSAFSLVELLVVIAIVGLLITMLLPVLKNARDVATFTRCTALFKSYALADTCYTTDNKEYFPVNQYASAGDLGTPTNYESAWQFHTIAPYMVPISGDPQTIDSQWYNKFICPAETVPVTATAALRFSVGCAIGNAQDRAGSHYGSSLSGFRTYDMGIKAPYATHAYSYTTDMVINHYDPAHSATWFDGEWQSNPSNYYSGANYYKVLYGPSHVVSMNIVNGVRYGTYQFNVAMADGSVLNRGNNWQNGTVDPQDLGFKIWF